MKLYLLSAAAFLFTFGLVAIGLRAMSPEMGKYAWFLEQGQNAEVVFVGSSRVYRQLDPKHFERTTAQGGEPLRAFNLGQPGSQLSESTYLAERVLKQSEGTVRWVVVEAFEMHGAIDRDNAASYRQVEWHDMERTLGCVYALWCSSMRQPSLSHISRRLIETLGHLRLWGQRFSNMGLAGDVFASIGAKDNLATPEHLEQVGYDLHGFTPLQGNNLTLHDRGNFASHQKKRKRIELQARALPATLKKASAPEELKRVVERLEAVADESGAEILWFIHPGAGEQDWHYLQDSGILNHLIDFSDPTLSSAWYGDELRYDYGHLNWRGAKKMTSLVAQEILRIQRLKMTAPESSMHE